jgi:two-component system response regulator PilR (NtrC family)
MKPKILVVDDEKSMREFLEIMLRKEGYEVACARDGKEALNSLKARPYDLVLSDIRMPGVDGMEVLNRAKENSPGTIVIMITAYGSTESAVEAMKRGAYDYITKPFQVDEIKLIIRKALEKKTLEEENIQLRKELESKYQFGNLVGNSPGMLKVYDLIQRVKDTRANILISGESGTGKELVAKAVHYNSPRKDKSFVTINCSAIPETLMESELFGHMKGAFTGAFSNKQGLFEAAEGGAVFLDEIGELSPSLQVKLLRVIQDRIFRRVGGTEDIEVDVRIITATNKNLEEEVRQGGFREDLFYRLNVIQIKIPPLRERREDIPVLARHFLDRYSRELGKGIKKISEEAMGRLVNYSYPGNVRELENIIERAVALESSSAILPESLPPVVFEKPSEIALREEIELPPAGLDLEEVVGGIEKGLLLKALQNARGVKKEAAKLLKISFRSLRYRLKKYGLES